MIFRSEEREIRFNSAIASEIANLKASTGTAPTQKYSQRLVLQGIDLNTQSSTSFDDEKEYSSYVVEMYDYVVELESLITEEHQLYKYLLVEHD